ADEGTGVSPGVPDVPTYDSDNEQISWKSSDDEDDNDADSQGNNDQDDEKEQTESGNDGDDFLYPKLSTFDEEERHDKKHDEEEEAQQRSFSVSPGFISNMLNPNPYTGINSILNLNNESTSLVDVPVTTNLEMPSLSVITLPLLPIPLIQPQQQTPVTSPVIVSSTSLQNLPTFGSLFKFEDRVKALEDVFSEFKQTNLFAKTVSLIPDIVDAYLANKMNEAVKIVVQLQLDRLRDEAQAENEDFINKPKTSHAVAANLFVLELKKILIDKIESNMSFHRSVQQKTLYKALINAYETDKVILDTYRDTITIKRHRDNEDDDEEPSVGSNQGNLAQKDDSHDSFNELTDTPLDFSAFVMNWLKVDTLTLELLVGLTFKLMKGSCKSLVELEYFFEESLVSINYFNHALWGISHWDASVNSSMDMLSIGNQLVMSTPGTKSLPLQSFRFIVIQRRVEDLQLGVESYQKKLNLTRSDTYKSDLKRFPTYLAYPNPRGFIYQNKDKKNRLMHINELHKFSDGTLNDVRTALDDILKRIKMKYLPQTYWRNVDKERAGAMIQAIDKKLKNKRIMGSQEKFIGGRPYEGDFRLLERTI
nr:hypothetical protein [Tanacetum cinerariifolium]